MDAPRAAATDSVVARPSPGAGRSIVGVESWSGLTPGGGCLNRHISATCEMPTMVRRWLRLGWCVVGPCGSDRGVVQCVVCDGEMLQSRYKCVNVCVSYTMKVKTVVGFTRRFRNVLRNVLWN